MEGQPKPSQHFEERAEEAITTVAHYAGPGASDMQVLGAGFRAIACALLAIACAIRER
jgi:hypothetical protein